METVDLGWNQVCEAGKENILDAWNSLAKCEPDNSKQPYGDGDVALKIVKLLQGA